MTSPTAKPAIGERTLALKAVPFFTQMSDQELDVIRAVAVEKSYPKHAVVLTEGEIGDSLYMIESGRVKVFIGDEEGREIILKLLGPGHFFGEMAMIDQQPRSASVTTLEPSTFLILSHQRLRALPRAHPAHRQHGAARAGAARARGRPQDRHPRPHGRLRPRGEHAARAGRAT